MNAKPTLLTAALALTLAACTTTHNAQISEVETKAKALQDSLPQAPYHKYSTRLDTPYLGRRQGDRAPERNLPAVLTGQVQAERFARTERLSLKEFAERVTLTTGVPVVLADDALKDTSSLSINFGGRSAVPLSRILDLTLWPSNLQWSYQSERILISRTAVRTWEISAPVGRATLTSSASTDGNASTGQQTNGGGNRQSSNASATTTTTLDPWAETATDVKRLLGREKDVEINAAAGTLTVRGTRDELEAVDQYVKQQNARYSRTVLVRLDVFRVQLSEEAGAGVDFSALLTDGKWRLFTNGGSSAVPSGGGRLTGVQLNKSGTAPTVAAPGLTGDGWTGSAGTRFFIDQLSKVGRTAQVYNRIIPMRNMTTQTIQFSDSDKYVSKVSPATVVAGQVIPGSVEQETLTTGNTLTLFARVLDDGRVSLVLDLNMSTRSPFLPFDTGSGKVQNVSWKFLANRQDALVKNGEPYVVGVMSARRVGDASSQGLLSYSKYGDEVDDRFVIVATAILER